MKDRQINNLLKAEIARQHKVVNLIASENKVSTDVLEALGSVLTNKYSEGYPGKRYYGGNKYIDKIEKLCQQRALSLFGLKKKEWHVNVQPYSGSPANFAVYLSLLKPGDKIMGLQLSSGGHLTHGHPASQTGKIWKSIQYEVNNDGYLDYDNIEKLAKKHKPKLIVAGYTAYSRHIDFRRFKQIADTIGAYLMVDMSHIAGLVAAGEHPSPFLYADVVTSTTHKTLRGPRGALIFCKKEFAKKIDNTIIPGFQGGPHNNNIAGIAIALKEANTKQFRKYTQQVIQYAQIFADTLKQNGFRIITNGTDNHLFVVDTITSVNKTGAEVEKILEKHNIIVNKNTIPFDTRSPFDPSGIRIGTACITTEGYTTDDVYRLTLKIVGILK